MAIIERNGYLKLIQRDCKEKTSKTTTIYDNHTANILVPILFKTFSCSSKFLLNCYICLGSMLTRTLASSLKTVHVIRVARQGQRGSIVGECSPYQLDTFSDAFRPSDLLQDTRPTLMGAKSCNDLLWVFILDLENISKKGNLADRVKMI